MAKAKTKLSTDIKVEWELLGESPRTKVNQLIEFYKKDKAKAKTIYYQEKTKYTYNRLLLFNKPNGNFEIAIFSVTYGISSSNIMYHRNKKITSIIYSDNKFYRTNAIKGAPKFTQLNYFGLESFLHSANGIINRNSKETVLEFLISKFSWIRWIEENEDLYDLCFNSIIRYKLKNPSDCLRHKYGVPINIAKIVQNGKNHNYGGDKGNFKIWKEMKKVLEGVQNLTLELYENPLLIDTCKMAASLGRKVNCSWGAKRLKEEHDKWSKEITMIMLEFSDLQKLNISKIYLDFAKFSKYKILKTNKDMIYEGKVQNHCVATYISSVDSGSCGIYHVNGYTLQLKVPTVRVTAPTTMYVNGETIRTDWTITDPPKTAKLMIAQFKGLNNAEAPQELYHDVQLKIDEFSKIENFDEVSNFYTEDTEDTELTNDNNVMIGVEDVKLFHDDLLFI